MESINPTDLSDIPPGIVLDTWRRIDARIQNALPKPWIHPYPPPQDEAWKDRGYIAQDPTRPTMSLTWIVSQVKGDDRCPAIQVFLLDDVTTSVVEAPGIFFGEHHRAIALKTIQPSEGLEPFMQSVQTLIDALLRGEWPK